MRYFITFLFLIPSLCFGQNSKTEYTASNGVTYRIGDEIELGRGAANDGSFIYLHVSGWGAVLGARDYVGASYAGTVVILKKIKYIRERGRERALFLVGGGNITDYSLEIENAIRSCEVIPCGKKKKPASVADELKKLNELRKEGAITDEEYEQQKQKLLHK